MWKSIKLLLKDSKEDLNKWGASAFLSMNMAYHKEVALQTDLWTQCCFISSVKGFQEISYTNSNPYMEEQRT